MSKLFSTVPRARTKRTPFNLSHERKLSMQIGQLIPILNEEVVPGDKWQINSEILIRLAPMLAPVMHRMNAYVHYFFVPNRILWDGWEDFITGGRLGSDKSVIPTHVYSDKIAKGSLFDYLGLPVQTSGSVTDLQLSKLPTAAYLSIYNEYYRDQNLEEEIDILKNVSGLQKPLYRAWEKDYFTSALPWTQRGGPAQAPLTVFPTYRNQSEVYTADGNQAGGDITADTGLLESGLTPARVENLLSTISGVIDINDFRTAHRVQKWLERQARSGSRYIETLLSHFGIAPNDARLQRPEFLGGGITPVQISAVSNTNGMQSGAQGYENMPLGTQAGQGLAIGNTNRTNRYFTEHGYVMGILSVIPKTAYSQGIHKSWTRADKFDFYWPEFAHLGEQEVLNKELILADDDTAHDEVFGYQSRYAEYKYKSSSVHGDFRDTMNFWHMGREFDTSNEPHLSKEFVTCDPAETERVFAVVQQPDETQYKTDNLWVHVYNNITAVRPMPYYGEPTL